MDSGNGIEIALGELVAATPQLKPTPSIMNDTTNTASSPVPNQGVHAHGAGAMR